MLHTYSRSERVDRSFRRLRNVSNCAWMKYSAPTGSIQKDRNPSRAYGIADNEQFWLAVKIGELSGAVVRIGFYSGAGESCLKVVIRLTAVFRRGSSMRLVTRKTVQSLPECRQLDRRDYARPR